MNKFILEYGPIVNKEAPMEPFWNLFFGNLLNLRARVSASAIPRRN